MRRSLIPLVFTVALVACDPDAGTTGPEKPFRFAVPGTATTSVAITGTWSRSVTFLDELGVPQSSETVWRFNADGSAIRSILLRDARNGIVERQDAFARWEVQGTQLVIDFTAPFTGRLQLTFVREGETLILGGQTFVRA
jgi:hypothetical protein